MWELDCKEGWVLKNWCLPTVVLKKTRESPLDCKEIKPVSPKGIFTGRTDTETEAPILWPTDVKHQLIGKYPDAGTDWRQEKRTTEDEMVGWHHRLDGHGFEQAPGNSEGQGSLAHCSPWGCKVRHDLATEQQSCNQWYRTDLAKLAFSLLFCGRAKLCLFVYQILLRMKYLAPPQMWLLVWNFGTYLATVPQ